MKWLVVFLTVLFAALALQAGLLAFALYAFAGVLLSNRYLAKQWVGSMVATRETGALEPVEIGGEVDVKIRLRNQGKLTVAWVLIEDLLPTAALRQKPPRLRSKANGSRWR